MSSITTSFAVPSRNHPTAGRAPASSPMGDNPILVLVRFNSRFWKATKALPRSGPTGSTLRLPFSVYRR
jgi:hypothetical protein